MGFQITWIQLIIVCAIANALIFGLLLIEKRENRKANRFLFLLILCMCLTFTPYALNDSVWSDYRWLAWLPFSLSYWIGPSFYFYVRALTTSREVVKKDLLHFVPIVLNYFHSIYHLIHPGSNPFPNFHHLAEILESASILSILFYMWLSYRQVNKYHRSLLDRVSSLHQLNLGWIKKIILVIVSSFLLILVFLGITTTLLNKESLYEWQSTKAGLMTIYAGILYWLSISGFKQSQTLQIVELPDQGEKKTSLSTVAELLNRKMVEERIYRNPDISLAKLSMLMNIPERTISEAINRDLGKNFYQFINEFRIEEVKEKLADLNYHHLKLISIAEDAGFNSKASFNRVFKLYTGVTPQQYRTKNS